MSFDIYYGRNFVKIDDKRFIPLHLHGASNCTEFINGREVLERNWGYFPFDFITTLEDLNKKLDTFEDPYGEFFARGSRNGPWISKEQFRTICKNAAKDAHTVEEFYDKGYPIHLRAWCHKDDNWTYKKDATIYTTEELINWYDEYNSSLKNEGYRIACEIYSREQIQFPKKKAIQFPCVAKCKSGYLCKDDHMNRFGRVWCKDPSTAHIFNSQEEIDKANIAGFGKVTFVKASNVVKDRPFIILIDGGCYRGYYITRKARGSVRFSLYKDLAKKFSSEKEAQKYIDSINISSVGSMRVVRVE